ncbi:MAG: acylphosphatase [Candidatus Omnitrophota bacterium]|jgi:acylphosphatase
MKKLAHIYYSGRVQGVGFRFTAQRIAEELGLCGWVRNIDNGKVEISAEGDESVLNNFLAQIDSAFSRYIQDEQVNWEPAAGGYRDFSIKFQ